MLQAVEVAADAEAAIAGKRAVPVEDRNTRQFDGQPPAAVDRPIQGNAVPGLAARDGFAHAVVGIEAEAFGDLAPGPPETCRGPRADQGCEFVGAEREISVGIHVPGKAQRIAALY